MPRRPAPVPPITPVERDLTVDDVRVIIEAAESAQTRRSELTRQMREALEANDVPRVVALAKEIAGRSAA
jgi:hypothetical protein